MKKIISILLAVILLAGTMPMVMAEEIENAEAPVEVAETPAEASAEVPAEAPAEVPAEPAEVPAEPAETPAEAPVEAPAEPAAEPAEVSAEPAEAPADAPVEAPAEPAAAPAEVPAEPAEAPAEVPAEPAEAPAEEPASQVSFTGSLSVNIPMPVATGAEASLRAVVSNANMGYSIWWEIQDVEKKWQRIEGATGEIYKFTVNKTSGSYPIRCALRAEDGTVLYSSAPVKVKEQEAAPAPEPETTNEEPLAGAAPAEEPEAPAEEPEAPAEEPEAPAEEPEAPAEEPEAPAEEPEAPAEEPEAPAEEPEAPAEEPEAPAEEPEAPAEEPEAPAEEPEAPAEEPEAPAEEPEVPAEEPEAPAEESEAPAEEPETPAEEPEAPAEEPEAPAEEPEAPAEEPEAPAEEPEVPAEEPEAPAEEPEAPAEEPEAPAEEPEAPAEEPEVPAEDEITENIDLNDVEGYDNYIELDEYPKIVLESNKDEEYKVVDVREKPDGLSAIFTSLPAGTEVTVISIEEDWATVFVNGKLGYIHINDIAAYLEIEEDDSSEEIIEIPKKVTIFSSRRTLMEEGEPVYLTSLLEGFEDCEEIQYVWKVNKGEGFEIVEGANEETYVFTASMESLGWDWHLTVMYR